MRLCIFLGCLLLSSGGAAAREIEVPLRFDHALVQSLLVDQIFTGPNRSLVALRDEANCNFFVFTDPEVGEENGRLRITSTTKARVGTPIADQCVVVIDWSGFVETLQEAYLDPDQRRVRFRVVDSRLLAPDKEPATIAGTVWDWVKQHVHPRLNELTLDLAGPLRDLHELLPLLLPVEDVERTSRIVDTLRLSQVRIDPDTITVTALLDVPEAEAATAPAAPEKPLTAEELARWATGWQEWDAFLTFIIKQSARDTEAAALRAALRDVLLEGRYDLVEILTSPTQQPHAVPTLFLKSWERLAPVLRSMQAKLPGETALRYLSFMAAADALAALERLAPEIGIELSADGLRRLARIVAPALAADPLVVDPEVDADLRRLMGFPPSIRPPPPPDGSLLDWLVHPAHAAAALDSALIAKLNRFVPEPSNVEEYLPLARELLAQVADAAVADERIEEPYRHLFRTLMLAAAWQESCWRQFVREENGVVPLRSAAGAVGIMQVNQHVWRGFYDRRGLETDIGYNARAGAEILAHYLVDYAIAKGEADVGAPDSLARATYAAYNGGPGHLRRYRRENTPRALRAIDTAFYAKFRTVDRGDKLALIECYQ